MAGILKNLLGNGINEEELSAGLRSILTEMQQERQRFDSLVAKAASSGEHLKYIGSVGDRIKAVENQLGAIEQVMMQVATMQAQAENLERDQRRAEERLGTATSDAERIRERVEDLTEKLEKALTIRDDLQQLLELERPFRALRSEADDLTTEMTYLSEGFGRVREQHDAIAGAQQKAASRLKTFDDEHQALSGGIESTKQRLAALQQGAEKLTAVVPGVRDAKHQIATLKSLTDQVTQKVAALEGQREAVERAMSQAKDLTGTLREFDQATQQQRENAKLLSEYRASAEELKTLHAEVLKRAEESAAFQREIGEQEQTTRAEMAALREQARNSAERFKIENQGLESVSQRVADLRGMLLTVEERFHALDGSSEGITDIRARAEHLSTELATIVGEVSKLDEQAERVRAIRTDVAALDQTVGDMTRRVGDLEASRPAVEGALRELGDLKSSREAVTDALEKTQAAQSELTRMRVDQAETQDWLTGVDRSMSGLREQVEELSKLKPTVEFVRKDAQQAVEATKAIESRRHAVTELQKQLSEITSSAARMDERSQGLISRMDAAEHRFEALSQQSEEAERLAKIVVKVESTVEDAEQRIGGVGELIAGLEGRTQSLEALEDRVRRLGDELDQRQGSLEKASEHLEHASALRQDAAAAAQELEGRLREVTTALASTKTLAGSLTSQTEQLEDRANSIRFVERRMTQFEAQLAKWELAEAEVARALDRVAGRQTTIDTLQADIKSMFKMAERTVEDVRSITEARQEVGEAQEQVGDLLGRLSEIEEKETQVEQRAQQIDEAEERLARADALMIDLQSSLETLQHQKGLVDQVVEKAGTLAFNTRQAEALIKILREERDLIGTRIRGTAPKPTEEPGASDEQQAKAG
jgi:chromosome segregation ATPase